LEQRNAWLQGQQGDAFCRWLDVQVIRPDGTIDVDRLFELAGKWQIDHPTGAILNPGTSKFSAPQLRLALGILLRERVPASEYEISAEVFDEPDSGLDLIADPYANASQQEIEAEMSALMKHKAKRGHRPK